MSTVSVDPRIRARRIAVRRDEGRRRLHRLLAVLGAAAVVGLAALATRTPLLDVDHVIVTGAEHTTPAAVIRAAQVRLGEPITDVDVGPARTAVASLPWVEHVEVARKWPGTIKITVVERAAVAQMVMSDNRWLLLDATGRGLDLVDTFVPGIPSLWGIERAPTVGSTLHGADAALTVAAQLPDDVAAHVGGIAPSDDGGLDLALVEGGVVKFGPPTEIAAKFLAVRTVIEQVDLDDMAVLDVRVPAAPALTRGP